MKTRFFLLSLIICTNLTLLQGQDRVQELVNEGIKLHDQGRYDEAIGRYKQALSINKKSSLALYEIAYTYYATKDHKKAVKYTKKVIKLNRRYLEESYMLMANAFDDMGKTEKAISTYQTAIDRYPENYLMYFNFGLSLYRNGQVDEAEQALISGIELNPQHASAHLVLGYLMMDRDRSSQALMSLYYFLLLEPDSKRAFDAYERVNRLMYGKAKKDPNKPNTINISLSLESLNHEFSSADLMLSLLSIDPGKDGDGEEEDRYKTEQQELAKNMEQFVKMVKEIKENESEDRTGFWWDFYVDFYAQLIEGDHFITSTYLVLMPSGESDIELWVDKNEEAVQALYQAML